VIGTLCVADSVAHAVDQDHVDTLRDLAGLASLVLGWDSDAASDENAEPRQ
jgi:hypothetical protein